jgi:hypothetical protein
MIYDVDYQLTHQMEEGSSFLTLSYASHDYFGFVYIIRLCSKRYKYCPFSIAKLNKFNTFDDSVIKLSSTIVDV